MKLDYIHQTKIDSKLREKVDYGRKIGKEWIVLLTLLLMSMQMAWAQGLTKEDLTKTEICDFKAGTISYTIPSEKISEGTVCTWTVKVDDKETNEGVKVSGEEEKRNKLTLNLSQKTRSVAVSYTDAESNQQKTISFDVEPKVYGKEYNGMKFYAEEEKFEGGCVISL